MVAFAGIDDVVWVSYILLEFQAICSVWALFCAPDDHVHHLQRLVVAVDHVSVTIWYTLGRQCVLREVIPCSMQPSQLRSPRQVHDPRRWKRRCAAVAARPAATCGCADRLTRAARSCHAPGALGRVPCSSVGPNEWMADRRADGRAMPFGTRSGAPIAPRRAYGDFSSASVHGDAAAGRMIRRITCTTDFDSGDT